MDFESEKEADDLDPNDDREELFGAYDYLQIDYGAPIQSTGCFLQGLLSNIRRYDFLLRERMGGRRRYSETELELLLRREVEDLDYSTDEAEDGIRPISLMDHSISRDLLSNLVRGLIVRRLLTRPLSRESLVELLKRDENTPEVREPPEEILDAIENREFDTSYDPEAEALAPYLSVLFPENYAEGLSWMFYSQAVFKVFSVFEQIQVLECGREEPMKALEWNLRSMCEVYCDEPDDGIRLAARQFLRAAPLYYSERRLRGDPRKVFDRYWFWCLEDQFRYSVARLNGFLDEDITLMQEFH